VVGARLTDISHAVESSVHAAGTYGIVEEYVGHGIGTEMHMDPQVPNYGSPGHGPRLVAGMALAATAWLTWAWGWTRPQIDPGLLLLVQVCWLVALLTPAIVPENLRPQVLGAVMVRELLPLKIAATVLYALCLPVLLQLIHESAPQGLPGASGRGRPGLEQAGFSVVRVLLWLPYCGLFSSLFFPPAGDDLVGALRFAGTTIGVGALSIVLAAYLTRRPAAATRRVYLRLVAPFAAFTVLVAILTAILS
jgi:hypothetical protein